MLETPRPPLCRSHIGHTDHAAAAEDLSTTSFSQLAASSSCVVRSCQQSSPVQGRYLAGEPGLLIQVDSMYSKNSPTSSESVGLILW